jgi:curved DNA-binding protein
MEFKDYYQTLGLGKTASGKEIKQAYRKLARKFHPDVNPGDKAAESRFKEINEAYEVLGDPEKRKKYDELGANWRQYEQAQQAGHSPFGDLRWDAGQGQAGGYRTINEEELRGMFGGENPFSDFFQAFFGGGGGGRPEARRGRGSRTARARSGRDIDEEIELSLEEAMQGTMRRLSIKQEGHTRTVDVRIPAGVNDGSRVRVPGEGEHGASGGRAGDLYLRIRLRPDPRFERRGRDLHTQVAVPLTTAVLGGEADVPVVGERPLRLKIPPTTQNGQVFRLKGHGMPAVGAPADRGDLYATVNVTLPRQLSPEQRRHYEELAKLDAGH